MSRAQNEPATALRAALGSPWPLLRATAGRIIRGALKRTKTFGGAAEELMVSRRALERIRDDFPSAFGDSPSRL